MNILLVDDQRFFLGLYEGLLKETNPSYNLILAETGQDAIAKFTPPNPPLNKGGQEGGGIDMVILDYQLPDIDGIQVLKEILKMTPDMPVIMVTGEGSEKIAVAAIKNGAYDYVVKTNEYIKTLPFVVEHGLERKRLIEEKRRMELQKVEIEKLKVLREVAATLNHEINNPLTSIVMTVHLLQKSHRKDEEIMKKLNLLMQNAKRIEEKVLRLSKALAVVNTDYAGVEKIIDIEKSAKGV